MKLNAHPLIELMRLDGGRGLSAKEENQKRNATGLLCNSTGENIQTISRQVKDAQVQEGKRWVGGKKGGCGWRVVVCLEIRCPGQQPAPRRPTTGVSEGTHPNGGGVGVGIEIAKVLVWGIVS